MLAACWSWEARRKLPLPNRPLAEWTIRFFGVDEWAAELGEPLDLREPTADSVDELLEEQRAGTRESDWASALAPRFAATIRSYEMLRILCNSDSGQSVLCSDELRSFASWQVSDCRNAAAWSWQHLERATPAAAAMLFIAQAFFVAAH